VLECVFGCVLERVRMWRVCVNVCECVSFPVCARVCVCTSNQVCVSLCV